jgi:hypothetical protein
MLSDREDVGSLYNKMNMENVDRVIAQILEGGEAVTGGARKAHKGHKAHRGESPLDKTLGGLGIHIADRSPKKHHKRKSSRSRVYGGEINGGASEVVDIKGGDSVPAAEAPAISGGSVEGGSKKRRLPTALRIDGERQKNKVMMIYDQMKASKRYRGVPGNKLLKKAMEQSKMM